MSRPLVRCPLARCWHFSSSLMELVGHLYGPHNLSTADAQVLAGDAFAGRPPRLLPIDGQLVNVGGR